MNPEGSSKSGSLNVPRSASFNFRLPDAFSPHMSLFKEQLTMRFLNVTSKKINLESLSTFSEVEFSIWILQNYIRPSCSKKLTDSYFVTMSRFMNSIYIIGQAGTIHIYYISYIYRNRLHVRYMMMETT